MVQVRTIPRPLLFQLYVAAQKVGQVLEAALADAPVRLEDATLLNQLALLEPVTPGALAQRLGVSPSTLTYRLKGLETRGWVSRARNPNDGRSALVALTDAGRAAWEETLPSFREGLRAIERRLERPPDEVAAALAAVEAAAEAALAGHAAARG